MNFVTVCFQTSANMASVECQTDICSRGKVNVLWDKINFNVPGHNLLDKLKEISVDLEQKEILMAP